MWNRTPIYLCFLSGLFGQFSNWWINWYRNRVVIYHFCKKQLFRLFISFAYDIYNGKWSTITDFNSRFQLFLFEFLFVIFQFILAICCSFSFMQFRSKNSLMKIRKLCLQNFNLRAQYDQLLLKINKITSQINFHQLSIWAIPFLLKKRTLFHDAIIFPSGSLRHLLKWLLFQHFYKNGGIYMRSWFFH